MLLIIEYLVLFGPALMFAGVGLSMFPLGLVMGSQGVLLGAIPVVLIELFSLFGLYGCFQLLRKSLDKDIEIAKPAVVMGYITLGIAAVVAFGLMGAFYEIGWHLYILGAPMVGAVHLVYLNRGYLLGSHS